MRTDRLSPPEPGNGLPRQTGVPEWVKSRQGSQFACPSCGAERTMCIDTRKSGLQLRRVRICPACGKRCTTYEVTADDLKRVQALVHVADVVKSLRQMADDLEAAFGSKKD